MMGLLGGEPGDLPDGGDMEADLESILGLVFLDPTTEVDVQPRAMCLLHALVLCWVHGTVPTGWKTGGVGTGPTGWKLGAGTVPTGW